MKITILAKCEICEKQFVFDCEPGEYVLPKVNSRYVAFRAGQDLTRHHYINSMEITKYGGVDFKTSKPVVMCRACDKIYWQNFHRAVAQLESFWNGLMVEGGAR